MTLRLCFYRVLPRVLPPIIPDGIVCEQVPGHNPLGYSLSRVLFYPTS